MIFLFLFATNVPQQNGRYPNSSEALRIEKPVLTGFLDYFSELSKCIEI